MFRLFKRNFLMVSFCLLSLFCKADELFLVKAGQRAKITIARGASPVEDYAARELQRSISLMSGASLTIVKTNAVLPGIQIVIGSPGTNARVMKLARSLKLEGAQEEQIAIQRVGNTLYLAGKTPRAALYATYTFLEDVLGVRWFWPGKSGEYVPKRRNIGINQLSISEAPDLNIRSLAITAAPVGDLETDTWMARNRMNVVSMSPGLDTTGEYTRSRREKGFLIRVAGHNIVLPVPLLKAHPEYLAEISGKRQFYQRAASHLCWSNPEVQNEVVKMISGWWDQSPYPDIVHFYPADQTRYCECTKCKAMGSISTRWQKFSKILIEKLNQSRPGKRYWTYAYLEYKSVPDTTPAPFEFIAYTLYDASYRHPLSGGSNFNKQPLAEINGWLDKRVNLGIRGYEFIIFKSPMFVPMVSWVTDQIRWIHDQKMTGYLSELPYYGMPKDAPPQNSHWMTNRMAIYAAAKAMWKSSITADSIVKDWNNNLYGPAAADMTAYYWGMEKAWLNNPKKISVFNQAPVAYVNGFLSPALFESAAHNFANAFAKIESITGTVQKRRIAVQIELETKMLANWKRIYNLKYRPFNRSMTDSLVGRKVILYDLGMDSSPLSVELQERGWDVAITSHSQDSLKRWIAGGANAVLIRYRQGKEFGLSPAFLTKEIRNYVEKGGLLILAANGEVPVHQWFDELPAVKWTASKLPLVRKSSFVKSGSWLAQPNDLKEILNTGLTPVAGYTPLSAGWDVLAKLSFPDGLEVPYLLTRQLGKGMILLSSSPMGYNGGYDMFGNRNTLNVVKLMENLNVKQY